MRSWTSVFRPRSLVVAALATLGACHAAPAPAPASPDFARLVAELSEPGG